MRLLLDTHAFIWWDRGELPAKLVRTVQAADEVYVSAASAWEISIKAALGKIETVATLADALRDYDFRPLPISVPHADLVRTLPQHHRDPFDRMLVAQAIHEGLTLVSRDVALHAYGVRVVWA